MKEQFSTNNEEQIRQLLKSVDSINEPSMDLENGIMEQIHLQRNHQLDLSKYKRRARIGMICSIALLCIFSVLSTFLLLSNPSFTSDINQVYLVTIMSILGLFLLFLLLNFNQRKAEKN